MIDPTTFSCPECGASYKRQGISAGKKVKCRSCETIITVGGAMAGQQPAPVTRISARSAGRRSGRSSAATRGRGRARDTKASNSKFHPVLIGVVVVVLAAVGVLFATRGGGESNTVKADNKTAGKGTTKKADPQPEEPKTPRQLFDDQHAAADSASGQDKLHALWQALLMREKEQGDESDWSGAKSVEDLANEIVAVDPNHAGAHKKLDHLHYTGDHPDYKDKWLTREKYDSVVSEWEKRRLAEAAAKAEQLEKERWTKDAFAKRCAHVRDYFLRDIKNVPGLKLKFYFDTPRIPKPYMIAVEDVPTPDPAATARVMGPGLGSLRKQFREEYGDKVLPSWDDTDRIVPVLVFSNKKSYENYRDHGHKYFPLKQVGAFYVPAPLEGLENICRGTLYVWQGSDEKTFHHALFHEATHQIMHNAASIPVMPPTPWLEEGIAEFWGAYEGNRTGGFKFRKFLFERYTTIQGAAKDYFAWKSRSPEQRKDYARSFMTAKEIVGIDRIRFSRARQIVEGGGGTAREKAEAQRIVSYTYALGWAFIFWSHYAENHKYIRPFHTVLGLELRHRFSRERLEKAYGIQDDDAWAEITHKFYLFCYRGPMRGWSHEKELPELPKVKK